MKDLIAQLGRCQGLPGLNGPKPCFGETSGVMCLKFDTIYLMFIMVYPSPPRKIQTAGDQRRRSQAAALWTATTGGALATTGQLRGADHDSQLWLGCRILQDIVGK